jgi:hypothetical protein
MKNLFLLTILLSSLGLMTGCGEAPSPKVSSMPAAKDSAKTTAAKDGAAGYQKPGAAIGFKHNFKGPLMPGEGASIELRFAAPETSGRMDITLRADAGLIMDPAKNTYSFDLSSDQPHKIPLNIKADSGKYYLNIFATVMDGMGQTKSRVFAIAIQSGAPETKKASADRQETPSGQPIMVIPSKETVIK